MCIFCSILNRNEAYQKNPIIKAQKYKSRELLKTFETTTQWKNIQALHVIFLDLNVMCIRCFNPLFQNNCTLIPCKPFFSKEISTPRLGKHIVRHTINYHPSPWRLTSLTNINNRIGIIVKCICGSKKKKKEIIHFYSCSPGKTLLKVLIIGPLPTPIPQV